MRGELAVPDHRSAPIPAAGIPSRRCWRTPRRAAAGRRRARRSGTAVPTGGAPLPVTRYADGRQRINLGSNNYLGLAGDPRVIAAAPVALRQFGTSTSGSRVLNGTTRLHLALEEELADHYGTEAAVLTSSGINANVALLSTICGSRGDVLLVDAHVHASVHAARPPAGARSPVPAQRPRLAHPAAAAAGPPRRCGGRGRRRLLDDRRARPAGRDRRPLRPRTAPGSSSTRRTASACSARRPRRGGAGGVLAPRRRRHGRLQQVAGQRRRRDHDLPRRGRGHPRLGACPTCSAPPTTRRRSARRWPRCGSCAASPSGWPARRRTAPCCAGLSERAPRRSRARRGHRRPDRRGRGHRPAWRIAFEAGVYTNAVAYPAVPRGRASCG